MERKPVLFIVTISDSVSVSFVNSIVTIDCFVVCMLKKQPLVKKKKIREVLFICFLYLFIKLKPASKLSLGVGVLSLPSPPPPSATKSAVHGKVWSICQREQGNTKKILLGTREHAPPPGGGLSSILGVVLCWMS